MSTLHKCSCSSKWITTASLIMQVLVIQKFISICYVCVRVCVLLTFVANVHLFEKNSSEIYVNAIELFFFTITHCFLHLTIHSRWPPTMPLKAERLLAANFIVYIPCCAPKLLVYFLQSLMYMHNTTSIGFMIATGVI